MSADAVRYGWVHFFEKTLRKTVAIWSCFAGGIFRMTEAWEEFLSFNWRGEKNADVFLPAVLVKYLNIKT